MRALRRCPGSVCGRVKNRVSLSTCAKRAVGSASPRVSPVSRSMRVTACRAASARHGSGGVPCAARTAVSSNVSSPSPSAALTGTTGMPSVCASPAVSTAPPPARSASITFSASTTGTPSSSSCSVRFTLRAGHVASAMLMIASASPPSRYARVTRSSSEKGRSAYTPGRSTSVTSGRVRHTPVLRVTVTPGKLPVRAFAPVSALKSVVLPQLGLPASARIMAVPPFFG